MMDGVKALLTRPVGGEVMSHLAKSHKNTARVIGDTKPAINACSDAMLPAGVAADTVPA